MISPISVRTARTCRRQRRNDSTMIRARIIGTGSYLPARVLANADLAATIDTSDEWIVERTGIRRRHIAAEGEFTSDLGTAAARRALDSAGLTPADIDLIIVATATPDQTFPACATVIQYKLGMVHGVAFDIAAVCSGFLYALSVADAPGSMALLRELRPAMRQVVARELRLKKSPSIFFVLDDSIAKAARIGDLLLNRQAE